MGKLNNKFPGKDVSNDDLKNKFPLSAKKYKTHKSKFKVAGIEFGGKTIPIFAGPNLAESRSLVFKTAKEIKKIGIHFMRAGAFKPLTFPYRSEKYYETREEGIKWLREASNFYKLPIISEIMEEKFLPLFCENVDILQIGSRNMQNYPLLTACAKTMKPIMLKRHYGSSIRDLLGAAEYILCEGNKKVLLCERGVVAPHTHRATSRFLLDLQAIPALKEITHLPIIVDPSHATFWSDWVESMALASIAAGADGVMLEVHPNPKKAAVDPLQPINFPQLKSLVKKMDNVAKVLFKKRVL